MFRTITSYLPEWQSQLWQNTTSALFGAVPHDIEGDVEAFENEPTATMEEILAEVRTNLITDQFIDNETILSLSTRVTWAALHYLRLLPFVGGYLPQPIITFAGLVEFNPVFAPRGPAPGPFFAPFQNVPFEPIEDDPLTAHRPIRRPPPETRIRAPIRNE